MQLPSLRESSLTKIVYKGIFYFELGKNTLARFYQPMADVTLILGGLKYLVGVDLSAHQAITVVLVAPLAFALFGYFIKSKGLYDIDRYVQASKDPVQAEMLQAARKINNPRNKV